LAINPAGVIPSIVEDDFCLGESGAILQYICESRSLTNWYPVDPKERARVNYWLHWQHTGTRGGTKYLLVPVVFKTPPADERNVAAYKASIKFLDDHLANNKFVAGGLNPSIADLFIIPELDQFLPEAFDLFKFDEYPNVSRYINDVRGAVSSYAAIFEPVKVIAGSMK
jgi:glutathione S-transferase